MRRSKRKNYKTPQFLISQRRVPWCFTKSMVVCFIFINIPWVITTLFPFSINNITLGFNSCETKGHRLVGKEEIQREHLLLEPQAESQSITHPAIMSQMCWAGHNVCAHSCENGNFRKGDLHSWNVTEVRSSDGISCHLCVCPG